MLRQRVGVAGCMWCVKSPRHPSTREYLMTTWPLVIHVHYSLSLSLSLSLLLSLGQLNYTFPLSLVLLELASTWAKPTHLKNYFSTIHRSIKIEFRKSYEKNEKTFILFLQHFYIIINTVTWLWNLRKKETKYEYCVGAVGSCFNASFTSVCTWIGEAQTTNYLHETKQQINLRTSFWHPINQPWYRAISILSFFIKRKTIHLCW